MAEEAIFSFVLDSILDLVIHEAQFLYGVEEQVQLLVQKLNHMRWFLRDTANQDGRKRVLDWVLQARDLAYEAENAIETYAIKVASRRRGGTIKRIARVLNECYHRHQIGSDIETLLSKITVFTDGLDKYGVRQIMENRDDGASRRPLFRREYSTVTDEDELFVGSHDSINMLVEKLVSDQYRTVSLHGMGGLGKTTLARKVYQHPVVMKHFDGFAWVSISQQWQKDDILRGILTKLMPKQKRADIQIWRDEELVRELSQLVRTSKCLLVLDDIWSIDAWKSIKSAIPVKEKGSKVLLTTRNVEVATLVDARGYKHEPKFLTADESWELLCNKALRGQDSEETTKKEKIGTEMFAQCRGLPLAVVALGGILSSKSSDEEWKIVCGNIKSYLGKVRQGGENVHAILALSYDDLPFQLKPCFLYLSKYAEDAEIEVETLYQYWMAEGMVSREDKMENDETLMDVAEHYLNELAERCMVYVQKEDEEPYRRFKSCRLHDLMRDLCIHKAKEEKFLESTDFGNINDVAGTSSPASTRTICRLSISLAGENEAKRFVPRYKRSLRSFTLDLQDGYKGKRPNTSKFKFSEFEMLRVLSIDGINGSKKGNINDVESFVDVCSALVFHMKIPLSIGKLVHLRYLCFRYTTCFITSASISNLKQLQTLDLRGIILILMPNVVWELPRLNHLYLPFEIRSLPFGKKLGLDGLPELEILQGFNNKTCNVHHLSTLMNLRKLEARVENKLEDLEELINHVRNLTHLRCMWLRICISDLSSEKAVGIMNDVLSCSNLVILLIEGKLSKFLEYDSGFCRNLRRLYLVGCSIEEDPLSTLERLPNLRTLILWPGSFVGKEMSCHASGFPQLRILHLGGLSNLEKWEIEDGAMPNLSKLQIWHCKKLEMIPVGLRCNTLLKKLEIYDMPEEFTKRIRLNEDGEEGADFHKVRHIQTIQIAALAQSLEDENMNFEAVLTDILGESAKKAYKARTRNDQV